MSNIRPRNHKIEEPEPFKARSKSVLQQNQIVFESQLPRQQELTAVFSVYGPKKENKPATLYMVKRANGFTRSYKAMPKPNVIKQIVKPDSHQQELENLSEVNAAIQQDSPSGTCYLEDKASRAEKVALRPMDFFRASQQSLGSEHSLIEHSLDPWAPPQPQTEKVGRFKSPKSSKESIECQPPYQTPIDLAFYDLAIQVEPAARIKKEIIKVDAKSDERLRRNISVNLRRKKLLTQQKYRSAVGFNFANQKVLKIL